MALKYMKLHSTLLIIIVMLIKTIQIYHFFPSRLEKLKSQTIFSVGTAIEKQVLSYIVGGNVKQYNPYGREFSNI